MIKVEFRIDGIWYKREFTNDGSATRFELEKARALGWTNVRKSEGETRKRSAYAARIASHRRPASARR